MKNVLIIGSVLVFTTTTAFSQELISLNEPISFTGHKVSKEQREENRIIRREKSAITPNYITEQHFQTDFPNATNVSWKKAGFEEASFTLDGKEMKAFYDFDNELIGTTTPVDYNTLPKAARTYIEKHYKGYSPQQVIMFDDNEYNESNMVLYGNPFDDIDTYFIELSNNNKTIVLQSNMEGLVSYFKDISYSNVK
ncbi:hypothetical protein [Niastella sp. OAS944]|uniref:hypothetical protein n=1 Tax=Niastella sp. OAS944 TaxID=2664089 RepID=UPI003482501F|nr:hypothetical protein [Chitinophagaceae bacterium OAS944]